MQEKHIDARKFFEKLANGELADAVLLDVREPFEWQESHLEPVVLMPLPTLPARLRELPRDKPIYCICAHGIRSYYAVQFLWQNGFSDVTNVLGGMAEIERYLAGTELEHLWKRNADE
ncbi:rhodanese-like domain-containing protein [Effusibacillus pohliae]|uniref:rhodanese-like domain-containing protein n=1 Tax=Effusibacillus pohliae TaxID=232270 RepID=UPI0003633E76|nr:rhodanese-like domain-containing protein [Effusibacillus pohliae]